MKVVALVPIKLNNQRLPGKNLKSFTNGEPLLVYTLRTLLECNYIDDIYVYCSSEDIKGYLPTGVKYLKRSCDLDSKTTTANDILKAFCKDVDADVYIMSHPTAPFIKFSSIDEGLCKVLYGGYDSAFSVKKIQDFIWYRNKPVDYDARNIRRTQDLEPYFIETTGFYVFKREVFVANNSRIGKNPFLVEINEIETTYIYEAIDFEIAESVFVHKAGVGNSF